MLKIFNKGRKTMKDKLYNKKWNRLKNSMIKHIAEYGIHLEMLEFTETVFGTLVTIRRSINFLIKNEGDLK